ncbi:glycoside hydrolase family 2 protein [Herbiconiux sp. KACC 21604]|uniref:glycoside hydrolase family 2 protein n=1 Tax=unclassified Herbiconiux TaxID=2618217 RepID=UPI001492EAC7|nr:glycoside hydrolase family 2 protein [Herbiconiux sp. SALV-R1]QJU55736.1 glycoside hydrolase family 2 protein [Herbiconiux sp. SALV-R1]WPO86944.1 glycoside hydrolase family 2 protein [Herbiconiux sp. KACC 21604]
MTFVALTSGWTVRAVAGPVPDTLCETLAGGVPATVPGVVHTDLLAAELIPDPYVDDNESLLAWIGRCTWSYGITFSWSDDASDRVDLVADGLDTVATVALNGVAVAATRNQHRSWRWDVRHLLREGVNELVVTFGSALDHAEERERVLGVRPHSYVHPFNTIRKTACNFGWDWGPALVTAGIWRRIGLESWSGVRIAAVRPIVRGGRAGAGVAAGAGAGAGAGAAAGAGAGRGVAVHVDVERAATAGEGEGELELEITATVAGVEARAVLSAGVTSAVLDLAVPHAELWWPRGHGEQPLYELIVTAGGDRWEKRIGFRSVELDTSPDFDGSAFSLRVNGEAVYVRGANWIPDDTFFPRSTRESLAARFADATEAGMNLLRVWGGGIYESEEFYELADEQGLLVWQDFLLACAAYSEDAELWEEFAAEAREAVTRLTAHPSLVLWNGGNENLWGYIDWEWRARLEDMTWGEGYYQELFPSIVAELAPGTPYSAGSPYGFSRYVHPNDPAHGTTHIWDVWNKVDYETYRSYRARFVSEFGFQGPPAWSTLFSVVHDEPADPFGATMLVHQKAREGNAKLERGLGAHIARWNSIDDWHWATQLNQARAVAFGIEHFRSLHPLNQGSIVWQLNDCWPVISWAAVDSLGHRKPLWHALRRVFADRLVSVQPRSSGLSLALHDDAAEAWETTAVLRRLTLAGEELARTEHTLRVPARESLTLPLPPEIGMPGDPRGEVVVADLGTGERALWWFAEDPQLLVERRPYRASAVEERPGAYRVSITATAVLKDLTLLVDRAHPDARVDRALVTLLPGETAVFTVHAPAGLDPLALLHEHVVRSANDLVPPRAAPSVATPGGVQGERMRVSAR